MFSLASALNRSYPSFVNNTRYLRMVTLAFYWLYLINVLLTILQMYKAFIYRYFG